MLLLKLACDIYILHFFLHYIVCNANFVCCLVWPIFQMRSLVVVVVDNAAIVVATCCSCGVLIVVVAVVVVVVGCLLAFCDRAPCIHILSYPNRNCAKHNRTEGESCGRQMINISSLTGIRRPQDRSPGSKIKSGCVWMWIR